MLFLLRTCPLCTVNSRYLLFYLDTLCAAVAAINLFISQFFIGPYTEAIGLSFLETGFYKGYGLCIGNRLYFLICTLARPHIDFIAAGSRRLFPGNPGTFIAAFAKRRQFGL